MEIERINENTVKFFLSYVDIESRGFTREEVWYNRDKSEELFWEMMDEINDETEFSIEGPLWIQVHAMSGGIEVTVTRAQLSADGEQIETPFGIDDAKKLFQQEEPIFHTLDNAMPPISESSFEWKDSMFVFDDIENLIPLASLVDDYNVVTTLYSFENNYYLHVKYETETMDDSRKSDFVSVVTEFGLPSKMSIHRLEEYGTLIMETDVFQQLQQFFS